MKIIKRFYDEDLKNMLMEKFDLRPSQITMNYMEEPSEDSNLTQTIFYIDIEENEGE